MKRHLRIIAIYFRDGVSTLAAYRFNLVLSGVANILWVLGQLYYLNYIFDKVNEFQGWSKSDIILLFAFMQTFVYFMFIFIWDSFPHFFLKITNGEFDSMLLKPVNTKFLLTFQSISVTQILTCFLTVLPLFWIGLSGLGEIQLISLFAALVVLVLSILIMYFLAIIIMTMTFFIGETDSLFELIIGSGAEFVKVPLSMFPSFIRVVFTFLIPVAFVGFYPASILKGLENPLPVILLASFLTLIFYFLQRILWNIGLKKYSGIA